jgi:hypothetical protein
MASRFGKRAVTPSRPGTNPAADDNKGQWGSSHQFLTMLPTRR